MGDLIPPRKPLPPRAFRNIDYNTPEEPAGKAAQPSRALGRPAPSLPSRTIPIVMDETSIDIAIELGNGNRSLGVREALRIAKDLRDKEKSE